MKISAKQANLLAKEVDKKLRNNSAPFKVSEILRAKLVAYYEKRTELNLKIRKAQDDLNAHDRKIFDITGRVNGIYAGEGMHSIIKKLEADKFPSISTIEDEIILKAMFASDEDLEKFLQKIVDSYTKKNNKAKLQRVTDN